MPHDSPASAIPWTGLRGRVSFVIPAIPRTRSTARRSSPTNRRAIKEADVPRMSTRGRAVITRPPTTTRERAVGPARMVPPLFPRPAAPRSDPTRPRSRQSVSSGPTGIVSRPTPMRAAMPAIRPAMGAAPGGHCGPNGRGRRPPTRTTIRRIVGRMAHPVIAGISLASEPRTARPEDDHKPWRHEDHERRRDRRRKRGRDVPQPDASPHADRKPMASPHGPAHMSP